MWPFENMRVPQAKADEHHRYVVAELAAIELARSAQAMVDAADAGLDS